MIHTATEFLESTLRSLGLKQVFTTSADLAGHKTPPYAAVLVDQDETYEPTDEKVGFEDRPDQHCRVYRYKTLEATLPVSVVMVAGSRKELADLRRRFLGALPREIPGDLDQIRVTPVRGVIIEDASRQRGGVAIDITVNFHGSIYREKIVPYFTSVEVDVELDHNEEDQTDG